ncbi:hypothetical protein [Synechococcus sp. RedBA-s]|uniref:hypothetical protein n=1 Tax=Synechococcus sp. RedBA-s TaxID=2823741 RepID=UPI0020CE8296|nr:hypothetical protein [Synechococcus sp. RedBA-s]MCP9800442.1 hypothetical protein [Synechococcus sp. RedBA-s]
MPPPLSLPLPLPLLPLLVLMMLVVAPAARSQTLIDAAGAAAIQGTLQGGSAPGYGNLLQSVEGRLQGLGGRDSSWNGNDGTPDPTSSGNFSGETEAPMASRASADSSADTPFVVNGRLIRLCPSGLPCIGQVRRAMGLR